jgi:hypothetical protein
MATLPNVPDEANSLESPDSGLQSPAPPIHSYELKSANCLAPYSLEKMTEAGFTAEELKDAGYDLASLKKVGFTFKQLKGAGFDASAFKRGGFSVADLKKAGFMAEELKQAGFDFASLEANGFHSAQLRAAGFDAAVFASNGYSLVDLKRAGFTAKELKFAPESKKDDVPSEHHQEISKLIEEKIRSGRIFGQTWQEFLGFFAPFGTRNSFWNRLKASPMIRHIFVHDSDFVEKMKGNALTDQAPSPQITASDVDSAVNNCALICALLIGIPSGLISNMGNSDFYTNFIASGSFPLRQDCTAADLTRSTFSPDCFVAFKDAFYFLAAFVLASFYTNIFSLLMAVLYYMCRPAENYNIASSLTLLEAFTLEVRKRIRKERYPNEAESKRPEQPFENPTLESEVFLKASFFVQNESEEQKNQEFYMWYKSQSLFELQFSLLCRMLLDAQLLLKEHHVMMQFTVQR